MIEMLGVLAIVGVLSVAGIAGYSKAMTRFLPLWPIFAQHSQLREIIKILEMRQPMFLAYFLKKWLKIVLLIDVFLSMSWVENCALKKMGWV